MKFLITLRKAIKFAKAVPPEGAENRAYRLADLQDFLLSQPGPVNYALLMVMYAGRDNDPIVNFKHEYREITSNFIRPDIVVNQMLMKVRLADYLEKGCDSWKPAT